MLRSLQWKLQVTTLFFNLILAAFIILWVYTGISKYFDFSNFKTQLGRSPFLEPVSALVAYTLPTFELLLALMLVSTRTRKLALYISFGVMLLFTGYIYIMLHYAYDLPCSCGGVLASMSWEQHFVFNAGFSILGLLGIVIAENNSLG